MTNPEAIPIEDLLRHRAWVHRLAGALVSDPRRADDVAQEAWVTALARRPVAGASVRAWLYRVVRSRAVDQHRGEARRRVRESRTAQRTAARSAADLVAEAQLQARIGRAVAALPDPYRLVVLLRYYRGLEPVEIAAHLDVPAATVRTRLRRGLALLRAQLVEGDPTCRPALLLLAGCGAGRAPRAGTALARGGLLMSTTQKIVGGVAVLVVGLAGGVLGAKLAGGASGGPDPAPDLLRVAPAEATGGVADRAPDLIGAAPDPVLTALRRDLDALAARLDERPAAEKTDAERLARLERAVAALADERIAHNEVGAMAATRNCVSALAQIQATGRIDVDGDGTGEFGGFAEMTGTRAGRMPRRLMPPVLSRAFAQLSPAGEARYRGYLYRIYLPGAGGRGVGEPQEGFTDDGRVDANLAETTWCLYAWPAQYGVTGRRTFLINQGGDTFTTDDARYSGPGAGPAPEAAFDGPEITGAVPSGPATDGNTWSRVR